MGYIIKVNSESKQALAFLEFAKSLDFVKVTKEKTTLAKPATALNSQQEKFKRRLKNSIKSLEEARAGKVETQSLDDFLKSLK